MIHFIIIMHFAAITLGAINLLLTWLQLGRQKDRVLKWLFYTNLLFTLNMAVDAFRIYISKNVAAAPPVIWPIVEFLIYLFSSATIVASVKLVSATTPKPLPSKVLWIFVVFFTVPVAAGVLESVFQFTISLHLFSLCFAAMLLCSMIYGIMSISSASLQHRPITIAFSAVLAVYWPLYIATSLIPGIPAWVYKIPYFQILYVSLNALGLIYVVSTMRPPAAQKTGCDSLQVVILYLKDKFGLTERELEIITEINAGKNNREISERFLISPNTVKNHIYNIYKKIGIKNRYELMALISKIRESSAENTFTNG